MRSSCDLRPSERLSLSGLRRTRMVPSRKTKAALGRHEWLRMASSGKRPNPAVVLNELHRFAPWLPHHTRRSSAFSIPVDARAEARARGLLG